MLDMVRRLLPRDLSLYRDRYHLVLVGPKGDPQPSVEADRTLEGEERSVAEVFSLVLRL
jgi:hypothetical protein